MECRSMAMTFLVLLMASSCAERQARKNRSLASASEEGPKRQPESGDGKVRKVVNFKVPNDHTTGSLREIVKRRYSKGTWGRELYNSAMGSIDSNATVKIPFRYKPMMHPVSYTKNGIPYHEHRLQGGTGGTDTYNYSSEADAEYRYNIDRAYRSGYGLGYGLGNMAKSRPAGRYGSSPTARGRNFGGYKGVPSDVFGKYDDYRTAYANRDHADYVARYRAGSDPFTGRYVSRGYGHLPLGFSAPSTYSWKSRDREIPATSYYANLDPTERTSGSTIGRGRGAIPFGSTNFIDRQRPRDSGDRSRYGRQKGLYGTRSKLVLASGPQNGQEETYWQSTWR